MSDAQNANDEAESQAEWKNFAIARSILQALTQLDAHHFLEEKVDIHQIGIENLSQGVLDELLLAIALEGTTDRLPAAAAIKIFDLVLQTGANIHFKTRRNFTLVNVIYCAVLSGDLEMLTHVLKRGARPNYSEDSCCVLESLGRGNLKIAQLLLDLGVAVPTIDKYDFWLLNILARCAVKGQFEALETLDAYGLDSALFIQRRFAGIFFGELARAEWNVNKAISNKKLKRHHVMEFLETVTDARTSIQFLIPRGLAGSTDALPVEFGRAGSILTMAVLYAELTNTGLTVKWPETVTFGNYFTDIVHQAFPMSLASYGAGIFCQMIRRTQHNEPSSHRFLQQLEHFVNNCNSDDSNHLFLKYVDKSSQHLVPKLMDLAVTAIRYRILRQRRSLKDTLLTISVPRNLISYVLMEDLLCLNRMKQDLIQILNK